MYRYVLCTRSYITVSNQKLIKSKRVASATKCLKEYIDTVRYVALTPAPNKSKYPNQNNYLEQGLPEVQVLPLILHM
jgi:hypothetical protein